MEEQMKTQNTNAQNVDLSIYNVSAKKAKGESSVERNASAYGMLQVEPQNILDIAGITKMIHKHDNGRFFISNTDIHKVPVDVLESLANGTSVAEGTEVQLFEGPAAQNIYTAFYTADSPKTKGYAYGFGRRNDQVVFYAFQGTGVKFIEVK